MDHGYGTDGLFFAIFYFFCFAIFYFWVLISFFDCGNALLHLFWYSDNNCPLPFARAVGTMYLSFSFYDLCFYLVKPFVVFLLSHLLCTRRILVRRDVWSPSPCVAGWEVKVGDCSFLSVGNLNHWLIWIWFNSIMPDGLVNPG